MHDSLLSLLSNLIASFQGLCNMNAHVIEIILTECFGSEKNIAKKLKVF